jgi:hypothetical protein
VTGITRHPNFRHILAVLAGVIVCVLVFSYSGDADLFIALSSGLGAVCLVYLAAYLPARRPRPPSKTRSF